MAGPNSPQTRWRLFRVAGQRGAYTATIPSLSEKVQFSVEGREAFCRNINGGVMVLRSAAFKDIPTQIKNKDLVTRRRRQIVDAAVEMFLQKGFHKTTTRQIAQAAGISIGLLYEYISTKEDILYLVCDAIHVEMQSAVTDALTRSPDEIHPLAAVIREYFQVCQRMGGHILLIYQETHSLPSKWRKIVLENEIRITGLFTSVLVDLMAKGELPPLDDRALDLVAHNISVLGHMWAFRRWFLGCHYTIDEYIQLQTAFILGCCVHAGLSDAAPLTASNALKVRALRKLLITKGEKENGF